MFDRYERFSTYLVLASSVIGFFYTLHTAIGA